MPRRLVIEIMLVVGAVTGCSTASIPPGSTRLPASPAPSTSGRSVPPSPAIDLPLAPHETLSGANVAGAFDLATDGAVIAWSNGTIDVDAPELWSFDPTTGERSLAYRSPDHGAILANVAVRHGRLVVAEVTPRADGTRTWRLLLIEPDGTARRLDANDVSAAQVGILPMAAISDEGVLWATSHAGDATSLTCQLRYVSLADVARMAPAAARILASAPCTRREIWYPRSDGRQFVFGTVEYAADGSTDERHVYLLAGGDLEHPARLDDDGAASLPAVLDGTAIWKAAPRELNMFSPGALVAKPIAPGSTPEPVAFASTTPLQLTTPSIGPRFYAADDAAGATVPVWDRTRSIAVEIDRLASTDPGFLSGTRLAGDLLAWFHTSSAQGGGTREIRWLLLGGAMSSTTGSGAAG